MKAFRQFFGAKFGSYQKGFTIVEFLVVLIIILIITGYVVPNYGGLFEEKHVSDAEAGVEILKTAVGNYYRNNYSYPSSLGMLTVAQPRILEVLPEDPYQTSGNNFGYALGVDAYYGTYFVVFSKGPNGLKEWQMTGGEVVKYYSDDLVASNLPVVQ
jgi:prepilin-type N-terminal cleavage/methylation domain-containing protein